MSDWDERDWIGLGIIAVILFLIGGGAWQLVAYIARTQVCP